MAREILKGDSLRGESSSSGDQLPPRQVSWRAQMARYVVSVDGQPKSSFASREAAEAEAQTIRNKFPILAVKVADWEKDSVQMLGPTQAPEEAPEADGA